MKTLLITPQIEAALNRLAGEISRDYKDKNPVVIGILNGSFIFLSDLVRRLDFDIEIDFAILSSYGDKTKSSGSVRLDRRYTAQLRGRHVLVVDDIVDSGLTLNFLFGQIWKDHPASVKLCALLDKPSRRKVPVEIDYLGFTVPDDFIIGYGMDYAGRYRNLPEICVLGEEG
ncbi:MAG: hypoxanthine phosphoribosyltransferase [Dehalococcoidia bacterium]|nr:hypoxanthine phosphoribosyltransferase [Dehalococcoidia bacterium]